MKSSLVLIGTVVVFNILTPVPAHPQFCWGYWGGCSPFDQSEFTGSEPRHHVRHHSRRHSASREERAKGHERAKLKERTNPREQVRTGTWQGMSQDNARNWVLKQVTGFCKKYPNDIGCKKRE